MVEGSTRAVTLAGIMLGLLGLERRSSALLSLGLSSRLIVITRPTTSPWYLTFEAGPSESPEVGR